MHHKYFIISMPNETGKERLQSLLPQLEWMNIDAQLIYGGQYQKKSNEFITPIQDILENNLAIFRYCIANNIDTCSVIEDDCWFHNLQKCKEHYYTLMNNKPTDYNILLSCMYNGIAESYNEHWHKVRGLYCGNIFATYSLKAMQMIVEFYKSHSHKQNFDVNMNSIFKGDGVYVANKYFAIQKDGQSLKDNKITDYNNQFRIYEKLI